MRLLVDYDGELLRFIVFWNDGKFVEVLGFSEGMCDQFYLVFCMVVLEVYFLKVKLLLFIVDDLFINFDDEWLMVGLVVLCELFK